MIIKVINFIVIIKKNKDNEICEGININNDRDINDGSRKSNLMFIGVSGRVCEPTPGKE